MISKTLQISYWVATGLFALLLIMDGIGGVTQMEAGQEVMRHLGYPMYLLTIAGTAKLLAALAVVQSKFRTIKEWAFAGFTINCVGAFWSRAAVGDGWDTLIFPIVFLAIMAVPYTLWKRIDAAP
jgi:uncharacterized membrane protein YphA (DoxX/SURF4 family)